MASSGHRRQVLLFLVAIILPCVVLVVLGLRMVAQERELSEKRRADERRALTTQLRQELSARLDRIALEEATALLADRERPASRDYANPAVIIVATVTDELLTLPWESDPRAARFRRLLDQGDFARLIGEGERAEIGSRQPAEAVDSYTRALAAASDPAQVAYARLLRGRASLAAGNRSAALRDLRAVLAADLGLVDEHGVPLALYAASRLIEAYGEAEVRIDRLRQTLEDQRWLPPTALYLLQNLVERLAAPTDSAGGGTGNALATAIATRVACTEQAIALQRDFPRLGVGAVGPRIHGTEARWVVYGTPLGFVARESRWEYWVVRGLEEGGRSASPQ